MKTFFVSDLHLSEQRPDKIDLFQKLMEGPARQAGAFYILGDLFEQFWIGMDDQTEPNSRIISILRDYADSASSRLYVMRGNRDFHLNQEFATATACQLIEDPTKLVLDGETVLLMHGDTLCTEDTAYQSWRRFITHPFIKWLYACMPLSLRRKIARRVRSYTVEATMEKPEEITDVSEQTVISTIQQYKVQTLIHGHTHRQAMHALDINGKPAKRIVLGDWYQQDCVLIHDENGFRFERVATMLNR